MNVNAEWISFKRAELIMNCYGTETFCHAPAKGRGRTAYYIYLEAPEGEIWYQRRKNSELDNTDCRTTFW